ncbi:gas vesicle protein GvpG [Streptomyces antimicrobicus]|uniref:Gas vesicle protein GvpG n=1 Tax=Streptomyces antimicrobicus TaxID=2883108 RepID=A0ABS8B3J9_9ACTN|nr:gas vesicle protein GvpG [Streptomyces antimicrobicus]MCB5179203.1 gas vesicle protein GvpG [Streptomyces antimicrobicus]
MGLLQKLVGLPLLPAQGVLWVAQRLLDQATAEYYDPAPVLAQLTELERRLTDGEIDEETFAREEDRLIDRLVEIERFRAGEGP